MNDSIGSDFDDFLRDQGMLAEVEAVALKRLLTFQIEQEMKLHRMSRSDMARRIEANATSIDALLDPDDASVTLKMLEQAARAVGKTLKVELA